jgi:hypothetical protein
MKTTLCLAFAALIAGSVSASAQAVPQTQSIQATLTFSATQVCAFKGNFAKR